MVAATCRRCGSLNLQKKVLQDLPEESLDIGLAHWAYMIDNQVVYYC
jgi:hypothetical protein